MQKGILIGGLAIILIIGLGWFLQPAPPSNSTGTTVATDEAPMEVETSETMETSDPTTPDTADKGNTMTETAEAEMTTEATMTGPGTYTDYSAEAIAMSDAEHKIIFFHASWCPSCRAADAAITAERENIPSDVAIFKVDFDEAAALKQQHLVRSQHSFALVDDNGDNIKTWVGGNDLSDVLAQI